MYFAQLDLILSFWSLIRQAQRPEPLLNYLVEDRSKITNASKLTAHILCYSSQYW